MTSASCGRHDEGGRGAPFGADGAEPIGPFIPLVARGSQGRVPRLAQTRVNVPCGPKRASSWSQISSGAPLACVGKPSANNGGEVFFKSLEAVLVGLAMARTNRKGAIAELSQNPADRALGQLNPEAALQFVAQIDAPPPHHAMARSGRLQQVSPAPSSAPPSASPGPRAARGCAGPQARPGCSDEPSRAASADPCRTCSPRSSGRTLPAPGPRPASAAPPFFSSPAAARSSDALKSNRVIAIAAAIRDLPPKKAASIQTFPDSGIPPRVTPSSRWYETSEY